MLILEHSLSTCWIEIRTISIAKESFCVGPLVVAKSVNLIAVTDADKQADWL